MIRVLIYFVVLALLAYCGMWLVDHPGHVTVNWFGAVMNTSAALLVIAVAVVAIVIWSVIRFVLGFPSFVSVFAKQRRREKGYAALSRGLIAVGSGDARIAGKASAQANRHLKNDPLAILLRAQAAHLNGDGQGAQSAYETLTQHEDTRVLGLRGLHAEAMRRGDTEAARHFAAAAHRGSPLPWSARAVLEHRASEGDWEKALATVESSLAAKLIDKETGERQRAVLETAIAYDKEAVAPDAALALARAAIRRAPDLAPPVVLAARLLSRRGDIRKASRLIEKAWPRCQHPDIARAYLDVRPGDSTTDRLARARTLMAIASFDPVSRMSVARAALAAKDFNAARSAMAPLIAEGKRPTVRMSLLMAELEEAEHGDLGRWREWLARGSRAPLDPAWVADGIVYDHWAPVSPTTGRLDAFTWQVPAERLGPAMEAMPAPAPRQVPTLENTQAAAAEPRVDDAVPIPGPGTPPFHRTEAAAPPDDQRRRVADASGAPSAIHDADADAPIVIEAEDQEPGAQHSAALVERADTDVKHPVVPG